MKSFRSCMAILMCCYLGNFGLFAAQEPGSATGGGKYKLTIVENASTSKRVKKGRVSSQAVVKLTDENDVPVAGIAVTFSIPALTGGGASFASGTLTSVVTTNALGVASSGSFTAAAESSFSIGAAASLPSGVITASVPVTTAATAAVGAGGVGAGISTGLIVGIVVVVGAAAAAGLALGLHGGGNPTQPTPPATPNTIGSVGTIVFK